MPEEMHRLVTLEEYREGNSATVFDSELIDATPEEFAVSGRVFHEPQGSNERTTQGLRGPANEGTQMDAFMFGRITLKMMVGKDAPVLRAAS